MNFPFICSNTCNPILHSFWFTHWVSSNSSSGSCVIYTTDMLILFIYLVMKEILVMVNNSAIINKANNHISSQITEHWKKTYIISVFYCTIQIDIQRVHIISVPMLNNICNEFILYQCRIIELILSPFFVAQNTCSCIGSI